MKQRVRVVGILEKENRILLMKKRAGRSDAQVFYEVPTGKIKFGEQPEEAMGRVIAEDLGAEVEKIKLRDVVTFLSFSRESQLANLYIVYDISIKEKSKINPSGRYSSYKFISRGELFQSNLEDATKAILGLEQETSVGGATSLREAVNGAMVFVDGGSRGNPGPAGIGYYIVGEDGTVLARGGEFIGFATSRIAEYFALKEGVEQAIQLGLKNVRFVGDNLMMINQMNGIYKIKNKDLMPIFEDIKKMIRDNFEAVAFVHVKREKNAQADREANLAIDRHFDESLVE